MCIKRLSAILFVIVFFISVPSISSQTKNRIAVSEPDRIKLYEFNSSSKEFDLVWESADISLNSRLGSRMWDLHIVDIDNDDKDELVAIDQFGIFVWGKNGKYPQYFPLQGTLDYSRYNYISVVDIDGDSRLELVTLRQCGENTNRISVWKINSNQLALLDEIEFPGGVSWSLRHGDFDGDGKTEILTSRNLIYIFGWDERTGLVIEAEIPNLAPTIDVVRPADIDGDGIDEIIASGNSGVFSVYKHRKIHGRDFYPLYFQSLKERKDGLEYSQGLHFGDIDGDNLKEILMGLTSKKGVISDNIFIYKGNHRDLGEIFTQFQFDKVFSMPLESSRIPGFVIGDVDNDGQNEVIYNNKFILKFYKGTDGNMSSESMGEISQIANGIAIGPFSPSGEDKPDGLRLIPTAVTIDLDGDLLEADETYQIRVKLKSSWHDVSQVRVRLESDINVAEIEPKSVLFNAIVAGQEVENTEQPFILRTKKVEKLTPLELKLFIETESGFRMELKIWSLQSESNPLLGPNIRPKLTKRSNTIAISGGEGIYDGLGIHPVYFNDNQGTQWPSSDDLQSYKNLILYDELSYALFMHRKKLKSFLDNGGNGFLQGYGMIPEFEDPIPTSYNKEYAEWANFVNSYLQVSYLDETDQITGLKGQAGDIITDGLNFDLKIEQEGHLPGVLELLPSAIPILFYPDGQVAGVRIDGPYKMVVLPFDLNDIESVEVRKVLLQRIMAWFDQE